MRYKIALTLVLFSTSLFAGSVVPVLNGTCSEVREIYNFIPDSHGGGLGKVEFSSYEANVGVFCKKEVFESAIVLFEFQNLSEASAIFNSLELSIIDQYGGYDELLTQQYVQAFLPFELVDKKSGVVGTKAQLEWGSKVNNLSLSLIKSGESWIVSISFDAK
ncbi:hypothetical protein R50072_14630 [Simiduia litorea]|uniref:hypothetical protein n=1 Tax=Simiduia litorea TaxID=1435348 RepID=UPI0036F33797